MEYEIGLFGLEYAKVTCSYNNVKVGGIRTNLGEEKTGAMVQM